jgi:hypothetical protein
MMRAALNSWKTTLVACLLAADAIGHAVIDTLDGNPATVADWNLVIVLLLAAAGMLFARDADKTSKEAGLKP